MSLESAGAKWGATPPNIPSFAPYDEVGNSDRSWAGEYVGSGFRSLREQIWDRGTNGEGDPPEKTLLIPSYDLLHDNLGVYFTPSFKRFIHPVRI